MKNHSIIGPVALAAAAVIGFTGTATAQQFSDNFDSGSLLAWGTPIVLNGLPILNQSVSAQTGALRMSGLGVAADPNGLAEALALPLVSSVVAPNLYLNGSASVDATLDPFSTAAIIARAASFTPGAETAIAMGIAARPSLGLSRLFVEVTVNGAVTTSIFEFSPFDFTESRMDASWSGDDFVFTVTSLSNPLETASIFVTDTGLSGMGGAFALATARSSVDVFEFGTTFDNFSVVPAPGGLAVIGLGGLLAARRRRSVAA